MKSQDTRKHYPFPEMVDERDKQWKISSSAATNPNVNIRSGLLDVPLDGSEYSRFLRNHELGHIRWSPSSPQKSALKAGVDFPVLQAVEDMRVQMKLREAGIDVTAGGFPPAVAEALAQDVLRRGDPRAIILSAVSTIETGETENVVKSVFEKHSVGQKALEVCELARNMMHNFGARNEYSFDATVSVAQWLQAVLGGMTPKPMTSGDGKPDSGKMGGDADLQAILKMIQRFGAGCGSNTKLPWGEMELHEPPRRKMVHGYLGWRNRASEEGCNPRNIHRLICDGRVFRIRRKWLGGAVLVDGSGSMDMSANDLHQILKASPGCTVAIYSADESEGVLRILAHKGRQVEDKWVSPPSGQANVIDFPALQWLAKQSAPRFWVSDGEVTGVGDHTSSINSLECETLVRRHSIKRCDDVEEAVASLERLKK